jgi:hypothetical protein
MKGLQRRLQRAEARLPATQDADLDMLTESMRFLADDELDQLDVLLERQAAGSLSEAEMLQMVRLFELGAGRRAARTRATASNVGPPIG